MNVTGANKIELLKKGKKQLLLIVITIITTKR